MKLNVWRCAEILPNLALNFQMLICGNGLDQYPFKHKSYYEPEFLLM